MTEPSPQDLRVIVELLARACDLPDVSRVLGVTPAALRATLKSDPDGLLAQAVQEGRSKLRHDLVHALYRRAVDPKGPQAAVAAMFLLKCLFGFDDRPGGGDQGPQVNVQIVLPASLSETDYRRRLGAQHPELLAEIEGEVVE